ncbi:transglutaminase-like domain-containing protein [Rurimicrobium arvi]|uniref:Transglutaminase-like domain-containing protein n=1 Tax=Rurimicrobium arvi TaxID=2049916 RepID=A0ABP8MXA0_9BACT
MKIQRASPVNETLARLLSLVLPTAVVGYFLLWNANAYFSILQNQAWSQTLILLTGMAGAAVFYAFRFRFITTFLILLAVLYSMYTGLDHTAVGEFDTFFLSVRFLIFSFLFGAGWLLGAAFTRWRYAHFFIAAAVLVSCIYIFAKIRTETTTQLLQAYLPSVLYAVYIIFAAEQIFNYRDKSDRFWWYMVRRLFLFLVLVTAVGGLVLYEMSGKFEAAVAEAGGKGQKGDESGMLKKNQDGTFDLKDYSQLKSQQGRSNELLFAAHIDNFFPQSDIPNPLYLTAFYYTKFDTSTETFERDKQIPRNDLFEPDVSKIPMYATRTDSTVLKNAMADKARRTVEVEVYNRGLSPSTYLAPNTGFFVQPIAVDKDFRGQFRSAFRAKGYVSELNSAYFIYNAKDPQVKSFQEQRFQVLRSATDYSGVDRQFLTYYTQMPRDAKFARITELTRRITANAKTPVDKVLAIRDYFLSKDEDGKQLFSYTDNPGVPDIPSASKLMYFLFDNHKGYCAYYAGATLFMLRSVGIPSRITVGFLTIDRSDKNKGWYWYYADQAHAWVQVYFPGFGWLDFDTTVGNDDAQESPTPDGTPPLQPPHAWFAAEGQIVSVDTLRKTMRLRSTNVIFHDKEVKADKAPAEVLLDVSIANLQRDSVNISLNEVHPGDSATAVSYAEALKLAPDARAGESAAQLIARLKNPLPTDDVYLRKTPEQRREEQAAAAKAPKPRSWKQWFIAAGIGAGVLLLLFFLSPWLIFTFMRTAAGNSKDGRKAYWVYQALNFYLHQLGYFRERLTPQVYAQQRIDPEFGTAFARFMQLYLKLKYAPQPLTPAEHQFVASMLPETLAKVRGRIPLRKRMAAFLRPLRAFAYFSSRT